MKVEQHLLISLGGGSDEVHSRALKSASNVRDRIEIERQRSKMNQGTCKQ